MNKKSFLTVQSQGGLFPHTHKLDIPMSDILNPSNDITITTSDEYSLFFKHNHTVTISKDQLNAIKSGKEVTVFDNDKKRHSFLIQYKA